MNPAPPEPLQYPWDQAPAPGTATLVREGVYWVRLPLPFALDHVNVWLLDDEIELNGRRVRGWTAIDCGMASRASRAAWECLFDTFFDGRPLLRVLVTHFHPDHLGLAHWLTTGGDHQRWRASLWMSAADYGYGRFLSQGGDESDTRNALAHYQRHGLTDPAQLEPLQARSKGYYRKLVPMVPSSYRRVVDREEFLIGVDDHRRLYRVIVGHGHAPEHLSFACEADRLLVSGDMVLPTISTNVSVFETEPEANPLPRYLRSLDRYLMLPSDTLVLPSHGRPFTGLHRRVTEQHEHHQARLAQVLAACTRPRTAAEIVPVLFTRALDLHQFTFALGEALAHLHALWFDGRLTRTAGADGVYRFSCP